MASFIDENKLNYDEEGNSYSFQVVRDSEKNQIVVCMENVSENVKLVLEKEFGDLVEIEVLACTISPENKN